MKAQVCVHGRNIAELEIRTAALEAEVAKLHALLQDAVRAALQLHGAGDSSGMREIAARASRREPRHLKAVE